jgi:hypothetical protein
MNSRNHDLSSSPAEHDQIFDLDSLAKSIEKIHGELSKQAAKAVNVALTVRNWLIGHYIAEFELRGADRASYGDKLLDRLADRLSELGVQTCDKRRLYQYLRFFNTYPEIVRSLPAQSQSMLLSESARPIPERERLAPADDNPPIGIVLCTERDHSIVEYALAGTDNPLFVFKYQLQLASVIDGVLTLQPLIIGDILVVFPFNAQVSAVR